jgi:hypothetical protein
MQFHRFKPHLNKWSWYEERTDEKLTQIEYTQFINIFENLRTATRVRPFANSWQTGNKNFPSTLLIKSQSTRERSKQVTWVTRKHHTPKSNSSCPISRYLKYHLLGMKALIKTNRQNWSEIILILYCRLKMPPWPSYPHPPIYEKGIWKVGINMREQPSSGLLWVIR